MLPLLVAALLGASTDAPPRGLACLARYYAITPERFGGAWQGTLPDGERIPWNDGLTKTDQQRFDHPDLHDMLLEPYPRGPIEPITTVDADPGRMRVDAVFSSTYGATAAEIDRRLVTLPFVGHRIRVHPRVAGAFARVSNRLIPILERDSSLRVRFDNLGGTFNWRPIAGVDKRSAHSYGIALDLNPARAEFWRWRRPEEPVRWRNTLPQVVVDAFEAEGFVWGGRWYHYDTMHFEYRPEMLDPDCVPLATP